MKSKIIMLLLCMVVVSTATAQNNNQKVKALKLGGEITSLLSKVESPAFLMQKGVLKPKKGYELRVTKGSFMVFPQGLNVSAQALKGATSKDLGGGVELRCIGCSKCEVVVLAESKGRKNYGCGGNCPERGCATVVSAPSNDIMQTMDGGNNWENW